MNIMGTVCLSNKFVEGKGKKFGNFTICKSVLKKFHNSEDFYKNLLEMHPTLNHKNILELKCYLKN